VRADLLITLQNLREKAAAGQIPPFRQVVLETSGLADPAPILRTLLNDTLTTEHYRLDTVVTTVDALYGLQQLGQYSEAARQAALAGQLILTKTDLADRDQAALLASRLQALNPAATLRDAQRGPLEAAELFSADYYVADRLDAGRWLRADAYQNAPPAPGAPDEARHDAYLRTFCVEQAEPLPWLTLERWIRQLTRLRGKDLLRVKGIAYTCETELPVVIQGVQHVFQPPATLRAWPPGPRRSQFVFITRNLDKAVVLKSLEALKASVTPEQVCRAALILLDSATNGQ
jgi:G3E family GTPase